MHLSDLKASEVTLRNSLEKEKTKEFRDDIRYALRLTRVRVRRLEHRAGIISKGA